MLEVLRGPIDRVAHRPQGPRVRGRGRRAVRQAARRDVQLGIERAVSRGRVVELRAGRRGDRARRRVLDRRRAARPRGLVPAFVDVEPDTFNMDVDGIEAMITPRTKAILGVNLIGNAPDWDRIRAIADAHGLTGGRRLLRRTRRDAARHADRHCAPTSASRASRLSHIITAAGTGGMVLLDDPELVDQCVLLRRWGRRSEVQLYGSKKGDKRFFSDVDGLEYDNLFIFDEVGWNFEPSELVGRVRGRAAAQAARRSSLAGNATSRCCRSTSRGHADVFVLPRQLEGLETGWHMFPFLIRPESGIRRAELQHHMESNGVDTRMVWTGNVLRQPAFTKIEHRAAPRRLPERRPGDGAGSRAALAPRSHRRRRRLHRRDARRVPRHAGLA